MKMMLFRHILTAQSVIFVTLSVIYVALDAFMLTALKDFYAKTYIHGLTNKIAAAFVWILYPIAIVYFTRGSATLKQTAIDGALLGLTVYGVYHLTSAATFPKWHAGVAVWDTLWGMIVTMSLALLNKQLWKSICNACVTAS
jgi:uncharacterized membrane protein